MACMNDALTVKAPASQFLTRLLGSGWQHAGQQLVEHVSKLKGNTGWQPQNPTAALCPTARKKHDGGHWLKQPQDNSVCPLFGQLIRSSIISTTIGYNVSC